jgi:hypothetical protein
VALASLTPSPARGEPAVPAAVQEHYDAGNRERDAGRHAAAAQEFAAAYAAMPRESKDLRATLLFDLVDSHRNAFAAGGRTRGREHPAAHLCAAEKALGAFVDELAAEQRKPKAKKSVDALKAEELRAAVKADLDKARADATDLDCATAEFPRDGSDDPPPEPTPGPSDSEPPPRSKPVMPLVIAGSVTAGVGLIMFGVMAGGLVRGKNADAAGNALVDMNPVRPDNDPELVKIDKRGEVGNRMAIAGGVLGGVLLGVGVTLLVFGLRGKPERKVAAAPYATLQTAGFTVRWQF